MFGRPITDDRQDRFRRSVDRLIDVSMRISARSSDTSHRLFKSVRLIRSGMVRRFHHPPISARLENGPCVNWRAILASIFPILEMDMPFGWRWAEMAGMGVSQGLTTRGDVGQRRYSLRHIRCTHSACRDGIRTLHISVHPLHTSVTTMVPESQSIHRKITIVACLMREPTVHFVLTSASMRRRPLHANFSTRLTGGFFLSSMKSVDAGKRIACPSCIAIHNKHDERLRKTVQDLAAQINKVGVDVARVVAFTVDGAAMQSQGEFKHGRGITHG